MRVLLDNNIDRRFAQLLPGHEVLTARQMGWADLQNGDLIRTAELAAFPVIVTADKNLSYQQNLAGRTISIVVLHSIFVDFQGIAPLAEQVRQVLENLPRGAFVFIKPV